MLGVRTNDTNFDILEPDNFNTSHLKPSKLELHPE
jgi:hypothetical protein